MNQIKNMEAMYNISTHMYLTFYPQTQMASILNGTDANKAIVKSVVPKCNYR